MEDKEHVWVYMSADAYDAHIHAVFPSETEALKFKDWYDTWPYNDLGPIVWIARWPITTADERRQFEMQSRT